MLTCASTPPGPHLTQVGVVSYQVLVSTDSQLLVQQCYTSGRGQSHARFLLSFALICLNAPQQTARQSVEYKFKKVLLPGCLNKFIRIRRLSCYHDQILSFYSKRQDPSFPAISIESIRYPDDRLSLELLEELHSIKHANSSQQTKPSREPATLCDEWILARSRYKAAFNQLRAAYQHSEQLILASEAFDQSGRSFWIAFRSLQTLPSDQALVLLGVGQIKSRTRPQARP